MDQSWFPVCAYVLVKSKYNITSLQDTPKWWKELGMQPQAKKGSPVESELISKNNNTCLLYIETRMRWLKDLFSRYVWGVILPRHKTQGNDSHTCLTLGWDLFGALSLTGLICLANGFQISQHYQDLQQLFIVQAAHLHWIANGLISYFYSFIKKITIKIFSGKNKRVKIWTKQLPAKTSDNLILENTDSKHCLLLKCS